jgi:murein DD-endopeptidase MepM/ murein hydrolase activator NlpD
MIRLLFAVIFFLGLAPAAGAVELAGRFEQGGMVIGHTDPQAKVTLDNVPLRVGPKGVFVFGFGRDAGPQATLSVTLADGQSEARDISVAQRQYDIQRIDGLPEDMVTPPPEVLARIEHEGELIAAARGTDSDMTWFAKGFIWPARGRVTGVYGSQRILNGEPKRPHFGLDVAGPVGRKIRAPAAGIVVLAERALYYTGGTVMIDHGHGIISVLMHMKSVKVKVGQKVKRGERIGTMGATGRASGPHVDWRVTWFGAYLDPQFLVKGKPND